jgi:protein TonB
MLMVVGGLYLAVLRTASENERNPPQNEPFILGTDPLGHFPEAIKKVAPVYPESARRAGIDGTVLVQALVGRDGKVKVTKIVESIPELDEAAEEAARQWEFKPIQSGGEPTPIWAVIPIKFSLSE